MQCLSPATTPTISNTTTKSVEHPNVSKYDEVAVLEDSDDDDVKPFRRVARASISVEETASSTPTPKTNAFLDLSPKTRNYIYRGLFEDQKIMIRTQDRVGLKERERNKASDEATESQRILRDRAIGLSILFTCKTILTEQNPLFEHRVL